MRAKDVEFEVTYIDLREKPDWFLEISPHGKVPVLSVDGQPLFESNAIAEFLDETIPPRLHPDDPIKRARNRAWTDFVPDFSRQLGTITYARSAEDLTHVLEDPPKGLQRLEDALAHERDASGPYFNGTRLSLVDASYAPFLQRFTMADKYLQTGLLEGYPNLRDWTDALLGTTAVQQSVSDEFERLYIEGLKRRGAYAAELME